jgi:hypothetical protein
VTLIIALMTTGAGVTQAPDGAAHNPNVIVALGASGTATLAASASEVSRRLPPATETSSPPLALTCACADGVAAVTGAPPIWPNWVAMTIKIRMTAAFDMVSPS